MRVAVNTIDENGMQLWTLEDIAGYKDYYKHLEAELFDVVMVEYKGHNLSVFIDDEGLYKADNFGRNVAGYDSPLFGHLVVTGDVDAEGETLALPTELSLIDMMDFSSEVMYKTKGD